MSRRQPLARAAKRAREPLVELDTNLLEEKRAEVNSHSSSSNSAPPDLSLLSLIDAAELPSGPKPRKKRGKYKPRLDKEKRIKLITNWLNGSNTPQIIAQMNREDGIDVNPKTLASIMKRQREGRVDLKPHHARAPKYDLDDRKQMAIINNDTTQFTYDQVRAAWMEWWSSQHGNLTAPKPSDFTLNKAFKEFDLTTKNLEWVPETRNDAEHIRWRKDYSQEAITWNREDLIFIDETGFNMHIHRKRGRSIRGTRAHATEKNTPGNRINMCAAVSPSLGLVKYKCILSSWNKEEFSVFLQELLDTPLLQSHSCIICMDNVSWHHVELVRDVLRAGRVEHRVKRIPSYSPHLNPIEYAFHVWKNAIKKVDQVTTLVPLQQQLDNAAPLITDHLISRCLDHVYRYYIHCIQGKPLEVFDPRMEEDGEVVEEKRRRWRRSIRVTKRRRSEVVMRSCTIHTSPHNPKSNQLILNENNSTLNQNNQP